ncbi:TonB-dependent receptor [Parvularcula bermudensis HTCC2503]|uniref:TonB-dependent receptor n=1 Tax=Parvularcula bermudensis (strain ATCC BAA-594 / HTCC2503 / KCTC 12087) TaxID=314260 RepID=E0TDZ9_PARBH|nr:TonB-dependent receptor [Parvularcula bermudensis]ADM08820.1 TonB-dependent receptor [Parvularcula bermudensis HTCC2503]
MIARFLLSVSILPIVAGAAAAQTIENDEFKSETGPAVQDVVLVTARRVEEDIQSVPIPVTALAGEFVTNSGASNIGGIDLLVPSVQFYTTNPRNSAVNIRGIGAPFGLTNDGIEQGVGLYVDGVYFARPASATLDFLDVEQIEVLRGPQGTLYGKNTTAGAINVTTRKPQFEPNARVELSYGNYGYLQARGALTGPLTDTIAASIAFSGTQRDGVLYNTATQDDLNDINNIGVRGAILFAPSDSLSITLSGDVTRQRPEGYAQVFAGVIPTLRPEARQYAAQAAYFDYAPPSLDPFDRVTDLDSPHRSYQDLGGASLTVDWETAIGDFTSITAWRYWDWGPSNDRDFLGLPIVTVSQNPSKQFQWSQEFRLAGDITDSLDFVVGAFAFNQVVKTYGQQENGAAAFRFLLNPSTPGYDTPGLLDGYGFTSDIRSEHSSAALFGQIEWHATDRLRIIPGLRLNYDEKDGHYRTTLYGGLDTSDDPALRALQRGVLSAQDYASSGDDTNVSGQLTVAYAVADNINAYATYATAFKTFGLNNNGLPTSDGQPLVELATIEPEDVRHIEIGLKTQPFPGVTANLTAYETTINDYQVNVVNGQSGVLRGYLANAEEVRVRGVEFDANARLADWLSLYGSLAWADGEFVSFENAPPPLEQAGGSIAVVDASGTRLPGLSEWTISVGGELSQRGDLLGRSGEFYLAADAYYRSEFSSSPTESAYLNVDGYTLLNPRVGFRGDDGWEVFAWSRNALETEYFESLAAGQSSSGYYAGALGDPRTWGVTIRGEF